MDKPYNEEKDEFGVIKRTFYETTDSDEFVWHRDKKDRLVTPINETDWSIQFDNELPKKMVVGETIEIPKESFHRVIKGSGDLIIEIEEFSSIDEAKKKKTKKDACYHKVKSRYKVWPSAYASGALVKCRKVGAKNWGNSTKEDVSEDNQVFELKFNELEIYEANSYDSWKERGNQLEKQAKVDVINAFGNAAKGNDFEEMVDMFVSDRDINGGEYLDAFRIVLNKYNLVDEFRKQLADLDIMNEAKKNRKLTAKPSSEKNLGDWFARKGGKGKSKGWVDCNTCRKDKKTGRNKCKPCGRKEGEKRAKYPACRPTPSACKTKGKGKSWGKKSKKKSVNENVDKQTINRFLSDFGMLATFNLAKVQDYAKDAKAKNKLAEMQRALKTFTSKYFDVTDPTKNTELYKPETLSKIIGKVGEYINYIKRHIDDLVVDNDIKAAWLKKIEDLSATYLKIIGKTNENRVYLIKNMLNENSEVLDVVEVFSIYNSEDSHTLEPEVKPIEKPTTVPVKRPDSPYTPKRRTKSKPKANR